MYEKYHNQGDIALAPPGTEYRKFAEAIDMVNKAFIDLGGVVKDPAIQEGDYPGAMAEHKINRAKNKKRKRKNGGPK